MKGRVKWFDAKRGFGFIYSEEIGGDLFVHVSSITPNGDGLKVLHENDRVEFDYMKAGKGLKAVNVKRTA